MSNFTYNKYAESLVYTENKIPECNNNDITLHSSMFCHNQGSSVYVISQNIYFNGKILFQNNTGKNGTGIYITDHSTIVFGENSEVTFIQNFAGGIIFLRNLSSVVFDDNSMTTFDDNKAHSGTVYSEINSNITFQANCTATFHANSARCYGSAIYSSNRSLVTLTGNSIVKFNSNIISDNYTIENLVAYCGGTIYLNDYSNISFEGNSTTVFINNTADYGGAIYSHTSFITFKDNSYTVFSNNTAGKDGGAIHCKFIEPIAIQSYPSKPSFEPFITIIFSRNIVKRYGGPLSSTFTTVYFKANSTTEFNNNIARSGGAISGHLRGSISFEGSSVIIFNNNTADVLGGAISTVDYCDVIFSDNSTAIFANNNAALATTVYSNNSIIAKGNCTVIFNDHLVKWCNNTCLPYRGYGVKIDSNGVVWCSNQKAFICSGENCYCKTLENLLDNLTSNITVNITNNVTLSSVITLKNLKNISIIGHNNITVICGVNGGGLLLRSCDKILVEGFTWIGCGSYGTNNKNNLKPAIKYLYSSDITIQNCTFQYSVGQVILLSNIHKDVNINHCKFMNNNRHRGKGAVIDCTNCYYGPKSILTINISNCNFSYNGYSKHTSVIYFESSSNAYFTHIYISMVPVTKTTRGHPFIYQIIIIFFILMEKFCLRTM